MTGSRPATLALAAATLLASCSGNDEAQHPETTDAGPLASACEKMVFEDSSLTLCTADPVLHTIRTALRPDKGPPWRSLAAYAASRAEDTGTVAFAMNGGMYDDNGLPIGYYVEEGERIQGLSRTAGPGNFHMMPNGVFFGTGDRWEIRTSQDFFDNVDKRPEFGTQSGPMLVIDGELHPQIDPDGTSLRIRNAVGVDTAGRALFAITDQPVSFGRLARFYRDVLKTPNVLFLDGTVSSLWDPQAGRLDAGFPIGPLIVVEKRAKGGMEEGAP